MHGAGFLVDLDRFIWSWPMLVNLVKALSTPGERVGRSLGVFPSLWDWVHGSIEGCSRVFVIILGMGPVVFG